MAVYIPFGKGYIVNNDILLTSVDTYGVLVTPYIGIASERSGLYGFI